MKKDRNLFVDVLHEILPRVDIEYTRANSAPGSFAVDIADELSFLGLLEFKQDGELADFLATKPELLVTIQKLIVDERAVSKELVEALFDGLPEAFFAE